MRSESSVKKQYIKIRIIETLLKPFCFFCTKKNKIMFVSWMGYRFQGNLKYVAEYVSENSNLSVIYAVKKSELYSHKKLNKKIKFIKFGGIAYFVHALSSKVFITDGGGVSYIPFKDNQVVINTWHGGGAYKKIGVSALGNNSTVIKYVLQDAHKYNIYLSSSKKFTDVIANSKLIDKSIFWEIGMPRNDGLILPNLEEIKRLRGELKLYNKRAVLYAPTFRDYSKNVYRWGMPEIDININSLLYTLKEKFGGEWVFLYRGHPNVKKQINLKSKIIDVTKYPEMQDLLKISDCLITDFSSSIWDFCLSGKPGFLYASDLAEYIKFRDFETPIETWPYLFAESNKELLELIRNYDEKASKNKIHKHLEFLGNCETGNATKLLGDKIISICDGNDI